MKDKKMFIFSALRILLCLFGLGIAANGYIINSNKLIENIIKKGGVANNLEFVISHVIAFIIFISLVIPWSPKGTLKYERYTFRISGYLALIFWLYFSIKLFLIIAA